MYQSDSLFEDESDLFDESEFVDGPDQCLDAEGEDEIDVTLPPNAFGSDDSWTLDDFEDLLPGL
jgi:hypothetical protein